VEFVVQGAGKGEKKQGKKEEAGQGKDSRA
jgi:hypothetical protein